MTPILTSWEIVNGVESVQTDKKGDLKLGELTTLNGFINATNFRVSVST